MRSLIPELDAFVTYEGSMTTPGCYETVTWLLINKPISVSRQQVSLFTWEAKFHFCISFLTSALWPPEAGARRPGLAEGPAGQQLPALAAN